MFGIVYPFLPGEYGTVDMDISTDTGSKYRSCLRNLFDAVVRK